MLSYVFSWLELRLFGSLPVDSYEVLSCAVIVSLFTPNTRSLPGT